MVNDKTSTTDNDIIDDIFAAVIDLAPAFKEKLLKLQLEKAALWGSNTVRRSQRDDNIVRDHNRGERIALLSRRYSLTERRVRQILFKK